MHGLPGFRSGLRFGDPPADAASPFTDDTARAKAANLWWRVASRYVEVDAQLRFEILSGPPAETAEQMRRFSAEMLASIRRADLGRMVYLTCRRMNVEQVDDVDLSDERTALSLAMWEPTVFTRQFSADLPAIAFPGKVPDLTSKLEKDDPDARFSNTELTVAGLEASIDALAAKAKARAAGREVYIGLFGALGFTRGPSGPVPDDASARTYIRSARRAFERHGFAWAVYDYQTGGAVRGDEGTGAPTRILQGLDLKAQSP